MLCFYLYCVQRKRGRREGGGGGKRAGFQKVSANTSLWNKNLRATVRAHLFTRIKHFYRGNDGVYWCNHVKQCIVLFLLCSFFLLCWSESWTMFGRPKSCVCLWNSLCLIEAWTICTASCFFLPSKNTQYFNKSKSTVRLFMRLKAVIFLEHSDSK